MLYTFFDKKSVSLTDKSAKGSGIAAALANKSAVNIGLECNKQLAKELHKPIIRNFKKRTVYSGFKENIWVADLADMQLIIMQQKRISKTFHMLIHQVSH